MKNREYKIFSVISLLVTAFYCFANLCVIVLLKTSPENNIIDTIFSIDMLTWHIYGVFAIATLIIKYLKDKKYNANTILHIVLMLISFIEIYYIISRAF